MPGTFVAPPGHAVGPRTARPADLTCRRKRPLRSKAEPVHTAREKVGGWNRTPHPCTQIDVLLSFRQGVPESRGQGWLSPSTSWGWWLSPFPPAFPAGAGSGAMMRCVEPCVLNGHGELGCRRTRKHFRHDRLPDSVASAYAGPIDSRGEACVTERAGRRESAPSRGFARDVLSENVSPSANGS